MYQWILSLLVFLAPQSPYGSTFSETARAIDIVSHESPIYDGDDGPARTAVELVAVAFWESSFNPRAVHADMGGDSVGLSQINVSNLVALHMTRTDLLDPLSNLRAGAKMMRQSHRTCAGFPWGQQLAAYASGRGLCSVPEGVTASKHRLGLARELLRTHPPFWTDETR